MIICEQCNEKIEKHTKIQLIIKSSTGLMSQGQMQDTDIVRSYTDICYKCACKIRPLIESVDKILKSDKITDIT